MLQTHSTVLSRLSNLCFLFHLNPKNREHHPLIPNRLISQSNSPSQRILPRWLGWNYLRLLEGISFHMLHKPDSTRSCSSCHSGVETSWISWYKWWMDKIGPFFLRFEPWSTKNFIKNLMVPSYGGWIKVQKLLMDFWTMDVYQQIGEECGGGHRSCEQNLLSVGYDGSLFKNQT